MTSVRLFLHVLAGVTWVLAAGALLWLTLRERHDASSTLDEVRQAVGSVSALALAVVVGTGVWNAVEAGDAASENDYGVALLGKVLAALTSFAAVAIYRGAETGSSRVWWAVMAVLSGTAALYLGVVLDLLTPEHAHV